MHILNCTYQLFKNFYSILLAYWTKPVQITKELLSFSKFHKDICVRICPDSLINFYDVRMIKFSVNGNLSLQTLDDFERMLMKIYNFDSDFLFSVQLYTLINISISSFSN